MKLEGEEDTNQAPGAETQTARPRTRAPRTKEKTNMAEFDPGMLALLKEDKNGWTDNPIAWIVALAVISQFFDHKRGAGDEGVRDPARLSDLNAAQTAICSELAGVQASLTERTLDITRDQAANALRAETSVARLSDLTSKCCFDLQKGQCDLGHAISQNTAAVLAGQRDLAAALAECCCKLGIAIQDTKSAVELCCCETQNAIAMQTATLQKAICDEGRATRDLIVQNRMDDLNRMLSDQKDENSNLRQTAELTALIRRECGHQWPPWFQGAQGGWVPPGQQNG